MLSSWWIKVRMALDQSVDTEMVERTDGEVLEELGADDPTGVDKSWRRRLDSEGVASARRRDHDTANAGESGARWKKLMNAVVWGTSDHNGA
jgi:hypothetical protein